MDASGESLGIYLQTIKTLMNSSLQFGAASSSSSLDDPLGSSGSLEISGSSSSSSIFHSQEQQYQPPQLYQQQSYQHDQNSQKLHDSQENRQSHQDSSDFLTSLLQSLTDLSHKLDKDRQDYQVQHDEKREAQTESIQVLDSELQGLEQANSELQRMLKIQENQHQELTSVLAKYQVDNFHRSQALKELDKKVCEGSICKAKREEVHQNSVHMNEKRSSLITLEKIQSIQLHDNEKAIRRLKKEQGHIESQRRNLEKQLEQLSQSQVQQIADNEKHEKQLQEIANNCSGLEESNEELALLHQELFLKMQKLQAAAEDEIPDYSAAGSKISTYQPAHRQRLQTEHIEMCLNEEIGDAFNDNFYSPLSSVVGIMDSETQSQKMHQQSSIQQQQQIKLPSVIGLMSRVLVANDFDQEDNPTNNNISKSKILSDERASNSYLNGMREKSNVSINLKGVESEEVMENRSQENVRKICRDILYHRYVQPISVNNKKRN